MAHTPPHPAPPAAVVITTKNRKDDLRRAVASALAQSVAVQVLVIDDGSSDGTAEMLRRQFPAAFLHRVEQSQGYIVQRNRAADLTAAPVLFSIDDDAAFDSPRTVEQTLAEFEHPRVGAVAIPYIDVNQSSQVKGLIPASGDFRVAHSFTGTAYALRREVFLGVGRFRPFLFHQGEEMDLAVRMLACGYVVRAGRADPIHHFESPRRDTRRMDLYGRRNDVLFGWYNVPMPYLVSHLAGTTLHGLAFGVKVGRPLRMAHGLLLGYAAMLHELARRRPVPGSIYRLSRMLKKRGPLPLAQIENLLPSLQPFTSAADCR